jgi:hypothetical protein
MGNYVVIKPTGEVITLPGDSKLDIRLVYLAGGFNVAERIKVRYEGKVRDCYLDEEGLLRPNPRFNHTVKGMAEAYYGRPCQQFAGSGVIWIPTPRPTKQDYKDVRDPARCLTCGYLEEECICG